MTSVVLPLVGLEKTISRNVVTNITREFLIQTGLDDVKLRIRSSTGDTVFKGYGKYTTDNEPEVKKLDITYSETVPLEGTEVMASYQNEHRRIAYDPPIDFYARPIYVDTEVTIELSLTTASRDEINIWKNKILTKISQGMTFTLHDVEYKYLLPNHLYHFIKYIHTLEENQGGYGRDFIEYLRYLSDGRLIYGSDIAGVNKGLFAKEVQRRIIGRWDIDALENEIKEYDDGKWNTSFSYKFTYQRPISIYVKYPIIVHNQPLEPKYVVPKSLLNDADSDIVYRDRFLAGLDVLEHQINIDMNSRRYPKIPWFDDRIIDNKRPNTIITASILVGITEDDKRSLLNLRDISPLSMHSKVLQWLADGEHQYVTRIYESLLHISLYENNRFVEDSILEVDADLNVKAKKDLNIRREYRVIISIIDDFCLLNAGAKSRLLANEDVLSIFFEEVEREGKRYSPVRGYYNIKTYGRKNLNCNFVMKTVQLFYSEIFRREG